MEVGACHVLGGPTIAQGVVTADGTYEIRGLPDGPWRVVATAEVGDTTYGADRVVAAGDSADLTLAPR